MADIRITAIETAQPQHVMPGLLALRIHTDAGYVGCGETYYAPHAVAAMIHDWMARRLLGADALAIEGHFRFLYERAANFGARGTELRAISAIDLALWDILGQATGQPVWQLLGGRTRTALPVYNSSGGPAYGGRGDRNPDDYGWPGYGIIGSEGPLNDYWSLVHRPVEYAKELLDEGIRALKAWTLDFAAHKPSGALTITQGDLDEGLRRHHPRRAEDDRRQVRRCLPRRLPAHRRRRHRDGHGRALLRQPVAFPLQTRTEAHSAAG
jgi:galactonate dehydratase